MTWEGVVRVVAFKEVRHTVIDDGGDARQLMGRMHAVAGRRAQLEIVGDGKPKPAPLSVKNLRF